MKKSNSVAFGGGGSSSSSTTTTKMSDDYKMGQRKSLIVDQHTTPMEKVRRDDETFEKGKQRVFHVRRAGIISPAIRVRDIFNLHMHEMRGHLSRVWVSSEKREREHVYARGGGRVCLQRWERNGETKIFLQR